MKLLFSHFRKVLFESLFKEDKNHIIDKLVLPDLQDDPNDRLFSARKNYKNILKAFFYKYPNYENKIDWNKWKTLTKAEFDEVMELAKNSKRAKKAKERKSSGTDPKSFFENVNGRKFKIIYEDDNWLYVAPLNYAAAVYCDSKECGGGSAKWCIGYEKDNQYWNNYVMDDTKFVMAFNKHFDTMPEKELFDHLKYMIEYSFRDGSNNIWNQKDQSNFDLSTLDIDTIDKLIDYLDDVIYIPEELDKYENVVVFNRNRIKNGVYTPPEYAKGIKLGELDIDDYDLSKVKCIFIPSNIKVIHSDSFADFLSVLEVKFEDENSDIEIYNHAFESCTKLRTIHFPKNARLFDLVLNNCDNLKDVQVPEEYFDEDDDFQILREVFGDINWDDPNLHITPI